MGTLIKGLSETPLFVTDLERSMNFYGEAQGLKLGCVDRKRSPKESFLQMCLLPGTDISF